METIVGAMLDVIAHVEGSWVPKKFAVGCGCFCPIEACWLTKTYVSGCTCCLPNGRLPGVKEACVWEWLLVWESMLVDAKEHAVGNREVAAVAGQPISMLLDVVAGSQCSWTRRSMRLVIAKQQQSMGDREAGCWK